MLSNNTHLPYASKQLLSRLDTDRVKFGLVDRLLSRWYFYGTPAKVDTHADIDTCIEPFHQAAAGDPTPECYWNGEKQWRQPCEQALSQMQWCSPEFLVYCRERLFLGMAAALLGRSLRRSNSDFRHAAKLSMLEHFKNPPLQQRGPGQRFDPITEHTWSIETPVDQPVLFVATWKRHEQFPFETMEVEQLTLDGNASPTLDTTDHGHIMERHIFQAPTYYGADMSRPSRLLRGPWNQAKGEFLLRSVQSWTWDINAREDRLELLQHGLDDAIEQCCVPALFMILARRDRDWKIRADVVCALHRYYGSSRYEHGNSFYLGEKAKSDWTLFDFCAGRALLPTTTVAIQVTCRHFENFFCKCSESQISGLGYEGFLALFILLCMEAHRSGSCTRMDVIDLVWHYEFSDSRAKRWGPWNYVDDAVKFVNTAWRTVEEKYDWEKYEARQSWVPWWARVRKDKMRGIEIEWDRMLEQSQFNGEKSWDWASLFTLQGSA